jgi:hypothetical protein
MAFCVPLATVLLGGRKTPAAIRSVGDWLSYRDVRVGEAQIHAAVHGRKCKSAMNEETLPLEADVSCQVRFEDKVGRPNVVYEE